MMACVADIRPLVRLGFKVIVESGLREQVALAVVAAGLRLLTDEVLRDYAQKAVHQAVVNSSAKPGASG